MAFFSEETNGLLVDALIESRNFARDFIKLGHVTSGIGNMSREAVI